jgi:hypothetical protein
LDAKKMIFLGKVFKRSSIRSQDPMVSPPPAPGESEIQRLNPQRAKRILVKTGWPRLEPGTLNLTVDETVVTGLGTLHPFFQESADEFVYPESHSHIPSLRLGYLYYRGVASKDGRNAAVLVRRAINPLPKCVELLGPVLLCKELAVTVDDDVEVYVYVTASN